MGLRNILLLLLILITLAVQGQKKGYHEGYIITLDGDTLTGWVKDRSTGVFLELYEKVRFKVKLSGYKRKYGANQILGYGYNHLHYISLPLVERSSFLKFDYFLDERHPRVFLRIIAEHNQLTYYRREFIHDDSNYLDSYPLFHKRGSNEMVRVTQGILGLKKKRLEEYFRDCPSLIRAIGNNGLKSSQDVYDFYLQHCFQTE